MEEQKNGAASALSYWSTAIAGFILLGMGMGLMNIYGFFVNPIASEFAIGTATVGMGPGILMVTIAITSALIGKIVDRSRLKPLLMAGAVISSAALLLISYAQSTWQLALLFAVYSFGFALYGPLVCNVLLVRTYVKDRARALAIGAMGVSMASVVLPQITAVLLNEYDWRGALRLISALLFLLLTIAIIASRRERNVQSSQGESDDKTHNNTLDKNRGTSPVVNSQQLLRMPVFWITGIGFALIYNMTTVVAVTLAPHFSNIGLSNQQSAVIVSLAGMCGLAGKLLFAALSDRCESYIRLLALTIAGCQLVGWIILVVADSFAGALCAAMPIGLAGGVAIAAYPYINSVLFDDRVLGRVNGIQAVMMLPLGILAPFLMGLANDKLGGYEIGFMVIAGVFVLVMYIFSMLPPSHKNANANVKSYA